MRKGFTLLELMVASLLLGMLVTILTQLFTQSSIAWSTAKNGNANMDQLRADISAMQRDADNALKNNRRLCGVWDENGDLNDRGWDEKWENSKTQDILSKSVSARSDLQLSDIRAEDKKIKNYVIGVTSAGPDREFGTWDDITTWPVDD